MLHDRQKGQQGASAAPSQATQPHTLAISRPLSPVYGLPNSKNLKGQSEPRRLPPEEEVYSLVRQFFGNAGLIFPYVHEETFFKTLTHFTTIGMQNAKQSWLALLNMILAMATSTTNASGLGLHDRQAVSEVHYRHAEAIFKSQMMTEASVEAGIVVILQCLKWICASCGTGML